MAVDETADRIVQAALKVFLQKGCRRTSLAEVAYEAAVTRITVYRYFGNKEGLARAVCLLHGDQFRRAAEDSLASLDARLNRLSEELSRMPSGNLLALFDEIRRLYPKTYEEFHVVREEALNRIFDEAVASAMRDNALREGVNLRVAKAMFWAAVVEIIESPTMIEANIPQAEICQTITTVLRHGMLKQDTSAALATVAKEDTDEG